MKTFPMFLRVEGRKIVIIGGGEQAAQKARLALKTEAELVFVAPHLDPELTDLIANGRARLINDDEPDLFDNAALVFIATGCKGADAAWHARAKASGALVNVVDFPALCDAITPSIVDRDPVVVAIGTEGNAPVLGRRIKAAVERLLHARIGAYAALAGRLRAEVARRIPSQDRRAFWHWVFGGTPWSMFSAGNERAASEMIKTSITDLAFSEDTGRLSIVTGAVTPDAITLGAVERMQDADVLFIRNDVPEAVTDLARRDANRVLLSENACGRYFGGTHLTRALNEARSNKKVMYVTAASSAPDIPPAAKVHVEYLTSGCTLRPAFDQFTPANRNCRQSTRRI